MQKPPAAIIGLRLRARYMLAGAIMLALWGASVVAFLRGTGEVHIVTILLATMTALPLGLIALLGGVSGTETGMRRARTALLAAGALLMLVVAVEMLRRIVYGAGN